ncbi:MAG: hypothetical protein B0D92_05275 [Spirochaeta sp. LUC14_002_19_P3]|nr:MAG: hypothetical protein B0D92_05275 [Spirochaeta sp. LUC14_002_19_P3]
MNQYHVGTEAIFEPVMLSPESIKGRLRPRLTKPNLNYGYKPVFSSGLAGSNRTGATLSWHGEMMLLRLPSILSALFFMIMLGMGFFDNIRWDVGKRLDFSGDSISLTAVQKASLDIMPKKAVQEAVFIEHRVASNETLSYIAYKYGLSPATLISVNRLQRPEDLKADRILVIPYQDGIRLRARGADLAQQYDTVSDTIQVLPDGDYFIPGQAPEELPAAFAETMFRYPVSGRVLTPFGNGIDELTGIPYNSEGIDLAAEPGTPAAAARAGTVIRTGQHSAYGLYVIMAHKDGWRSFYGHLGRVNAAPGDYLEAGEKIGIAGKSGNARTPRLHFVLVRNGETVNPLDYLY